jgi:hypothetical protein
VEYEYCPGYEATNDEDPGNGSAVPTTLMLLSSTPLTDPLSSCHNRAPMKLLTLVNKCGEVLCQDNCRDVA